MGGIDFINTVKGWFQTTETTTVQFTLSIFKHWCVNVKLHFLHIFGIAHWNYKHFKCIFIFCLIMPLKDFLIEIRFTCDKIFFNPIKIRIKPTLWSYRLTLYLEFIFILFPLSSVIFKYFWQSMNPCAYNPCYVTICFRLFLTSVGILKGTFTFFLKYLKQISENFRFIKELLLYNFVNFPPISFLMIVDIFNFDNVFNVNLQCHFIFFCLLFFF